MGVSISLCLPPGIAGLPLDEAVTGRRLSDLLGALGLDVREAPTLAHALALYGSTRSLDFADAYLAAAALEVGPARVARSTPTSIACRESVASERELAGVHTAPVYASWSRTRRRRQGARSATCTGP